MKAIAIIAIMWAVIGQISMLLYQERDVTAPQAVANDWGTYRQAAMLFVSQNTPGDRLLNMTELMPHLPSGYSPKRSWQARCQAKILYVWGEASNEEISQAQKIFRFSAAVGMARGGEIYPRKVNRIPVPGFVSEGSLVSVTGY